MSTTESRPGSHAIVEQGDLVCLGCGCLCDDIIAIVSENRLVEARNACEIGRGWFLGAPDSSRPEAEIDGRPVELDLAITRAAEILEAARRPILLGLTGCSVESQAEAVRLARKLGAAIDPGIGRDQNPLLRAFQRVGRASATLGEVKNRADLVVFWGVDPVTTHPRHLERYSADPIGRFLPRGRADRTVIVVGRERTAIADRADHFVPIRDEDPMESLWILRALVKGLPIPDLKVDPAIADLADRLKRARYAAIFFGAGLGRGPGGSATVEALLLLVRDLNEVTRSVAMTLGSPGNAGGAGAVLAWGSGFASGVDFDHRSPPRSLPGDADAETVLSRQEVDAALVVGDDPRSWLSEAAIEHLERIPLIVVGPDAVGEGLAPAVTVSSSRFGIDSGGSVLRTDGVMLPIRPSLESSRPGEREILRAIRDRVREVAWR